METTFSAIYEGGVLRPLVPVDLPEAVPVEVTVVTPVSEPAKDGPRTGEQAAREFLEAIKKYGVHVGTLPLDWSRHELYDDEF